MKHKTAGETNAEIKRLEEKVALLETKEKNISGIVTAVVSSLRVVQQNPQVNNISKQENTSQS